METERNTYVANLADDDAFPLWDRAAMQHALKDWREIRGLSQERLADLCGTTKGTISKLERKKQQMTETWLRRLAEALDVSPPGLLLEPPPMDRVTIQRVGKVTDVNRPLTPGVVSNLGQRREVILPASDPAQRTVPVYGVAAASDDGYFILQSGAEPVDYAPRGAGIMNSRHVFAFFVTNSSMEPRFDHGDLVYCDPSRPVRIGDDVVIELKPKGDGEPHGCLLKRLVRRTADKVILCQFNPAAEIEIPMSQVARVVHVLTRNELAGV